MRMIPDGTTHLVINNYLGVPDMYSKTHSFLPRLLSESMATTVDDITNDPQQSTHDGPDTTETEDTTVKLTDAQRARIERNRQKALLLKHARLTSRPYTLDKPDKYLTFCNICII